ncbi:MAG: tripartite tricarboxylate transporter substrate binding protein BugD, partial [Xanthobacteraceae bacterium]
MSSRTLLRASLRAGLRAVLGAAALALASPVLADYPERPITLVVPFAAGGPTDIISRLMAEPMSRAL